MDKLWYIHTKKYYTEIGTYQNVHSITFPKNHKLEAAQISMQTE